jgi:hypothetical protein
VLLDVCVRICDSSTVTGRDGMARIALYHEEEERMRGKIRRDEEEEEEIKQRKNRKKRNLKEKTGNQHTAISFVLHRICKKYVFYVIKIN